MSEIIKLNNPEIQLERFYRYKSDGGKPQSISDVANAGLSRIQCYEVAIAIGLNPNIDALYDAPNFIDLDLEVIEVYSSKSFKGIKKGVPYLLMLSGASAFSHDTETLNAFIKRNETLSKKNNVHSSALQFSFSQDQIDSLVGNNLVHIADENGFYHQKKLDFLTVDEFLEESNSDDFLVKDLNYGKKAYATILSLEERKNIPEGYFHFDNEKITNHLGNIIMCGGIKPYTLFLEGIKKRNYYGLIGMNIYFSKNTGAMAFASTNEEGFDAYDVDDNGASVGITSKARIALMERYIVEIKNNQRG